MVKNETSEHAFVTSLCWPSKEVGVCETLKERAAAVAAVTQKNQNRGYKSGNALKMSEIRICVCRYTKEQIKPSAGSLGPLWAYLGRSRADFFEILAKKQQYHVRQR